MMTFPMLPIRPNFLRLAPCLLILLVAGCRSVSPPDIVFAAGLGGVDLEEENGLESAIDGPRISGRFDVAAAGTVAETDDLGSGPRLGGRLGFAYARRDLGDRSIAGEPLLEIEDFVDLFLFTPQITASFKQYFGSEIYAAEGWFIEPGVGVGPAIGSLSFGEQLEFGNDPIASDVDDTETQISWGVQPYLRLGYDTPSATFGLEGGYLFTGLDFDDDLGRDASQWYVSLVAGIRLGP
jgi:hypothetical protein